MNITLSHPSVGQVSHHPPVSACHCDSKNFTFSQGERVKSVCLGHEPPPTHQLLSVRVRVRLWLHLWLCSDKPFSLFVFLSHVDMRWKNKFWGKSMEIVPMGTTHVTLPA